MLILPTRINYAKAIAVVAISLTLICISDSKITFN